MSASKYAVQRRVKLGQRHHTQTADTNGATISATAFGGYEFQQNQHILALLGNVTYSNRKFPALCNRSLDEGVAKT